MVLTLSLGMKPEEEAEAHGVVSGWNQIKTWATQINHMSKHMNSFTEEDQKRITTLVANLPHDENDVRLARGRLGMVMLVGACFASNSVEV